MSLWSNILFNCVVLINLIVAFFYPFVDSAFGKFVPDNGFRIYILFVRALSYLYLFYRAQVSLVSSNLGRHDYIRHYRCYFAKRVWYTYVSRVNDITNDFFCRSRTDVVVTRFCYGKVLCSIYITVIYITVMLNFKSWNSTVSTVLNLSYCRSY